MTYLNPAERQQVWNQRIEEHARTCEDCQEDRCECEYWQRLIHLYNTAADPAVDEEPEEK